MYVLNKLAKFFCFTVPLEMKILTREHFNRWYKLSPYLMSVILIEIPFQVSFKLFYTKNKHTQHTFFHTTDNVYLDIRRYNLQANRPASRL